MARATSDRDTERIEAPIERSPYGPLRRWVIDHDESWLFILLYVGLAVVLSLWISLFWLVAVVAGHGVLEWIRQSHLDPQPAGVAARVLWELRLDLALVLFALALAAYLEVLFGIAGIGGAAKLAGAGARAGAWARGLRGVLLSLDDAAQVVRALAHRRSRAAPDGIVEPAGAAAELEETATESTTETAFATNPWDAKWPRSTHAIVGFGLACGVLLVLSPALTHHDYPSLFSVLAAELHPWPGEG